MEASHGTWLKASLAIAASMSAVGAHVNWLINLLLISDRKTLKNLRNTKILPQNFWMKFSVTYVFEEKKLLVSNEGEITHNFVWISVNSFTQAAVGSY